MTSPSAPPTPVGGTIASRYRVLRELGRGGMGVVYVVEHTRTGDQMALKLLHGSAAQDPQAIERFRREARASARIKSEHVVKVVDADVAPELMNAPFLVMELLDGTDLQRTVERDGRLPPDRVMQLLVQAARALDKSHAVGIVHRDLKPENLFAHRREDGTMMLKILDFGISKIVGGEAAGDMSGSGMTRTGAVMGTPLYMAPEQARGRVSEIGPCTDVWALGLIALFLLTGEIYWQANTVAELMVQILSDPMYPPTQRWPWLPQGIDGWFFRSCARDPRERFQSVGEQVEALGVALGTPVGQALHRESLPANASPHVSVAVTGPSRTGGSTTAATVGDTVPSPPRSRAPLVAVLATLVLGGAAGALLLLRGGTRAAPVPQPAAVVTSVAPAVTSETVTLPPAPALSALAAQSSAAADTSAGAAAAASPSHAPASHAGQPPAHAPVAVPTPAATKTAAGTAPPPPAATALPAPPAPAVPAPKSVGNCNPPYVIDSAGHRQYKPECL